MAEPHSLQRVGSQVRILMDDDSEYLAAPTGNGQWLVVAGGVAPGGGDFSYPYPLEKITYGFRPPDRPTHNGVDWAGGPAGPGKPIPAVGAGVIELNAVYFGYGNAVIINHGELSDGNTYRTLYGHMVAPGPLPVGTAVTKGTVIGNVGNTGQSFGEHLHLETWRNGNSTQAAFDPMEFFAQFGDGGVIFSA